ncbi:type II toxin-antitoxin system RelE/ParE family toxin [Paraburkholderia piptadeniae]|nr:type II toxin-antitoxin system RelE/ParE family toxin [Paraburkholderia piptadeniae]
MVSTRPRARRDLTAHYVYLAENASLAVADRFLDKSRDTFIALAERPLRGPAFRSYPACDAVLVGIVWSAMTLLTMARAKKLSVGVLSLDACEARTMKIGLGEYMCPAQCARALVQLDHQLRHLTERLTRMETLQRVASRRRVRPT